MSSTNTRSGEPLVPVITTIGVVGTSDDVRRFFIGETANGQKTYVRPCIIANDHATEPLYVLVNEEGATDEDYLVRIAGGAHTDVSFDGLVNVDFVSLYYAATATYADALVRGWDPK